MPSRFLALAQRAEPHDIHSESFMSFVEAHLGVIRDHPNTLRIGLSSEVLRLYKYRFFSYLTDQGVASKYHHVFLRVNGLLKEADFDDKLSVFYFPSTAFIDALYGRFSLK